jgi:hypothetical protein
MGGFLVLKLVAHILKLSVIDAVCLAIKNELLQQKQTLAKQREEYVRKKMLIARELNLLREQEEELLEEKSRDNDRILKENNKLQVCKHFGSFFCKIIQKVLLHSENLQLPLFFFFLLFFPAAYFVYCRSCLVMPIRTQSPLHNVC